MSGVTLERAKQMLDRWLEAELAVTTGQSYKIGTRSLTRADMKAIRAAQQFWQNEIEKIESGRRGARVMRAVPRDL